MTNYTPAAPVVNPDDEATLTLTPESRARLDACALRILKSRHAYVRPVEASDLI
jgi:hypothetical protein